MDAESFDPDTKGVDQTIIWRKGVATVGDCPQSRYYGNTNLEDNRRIVLRVIQVLLSQCLYYKPEEYLTILNPFCVFFTCKRVPFAKNFFISLLNTVIDYDTHGSGIPYISASFKYDSDSLLIEQCLGILNVLIEYRPPTKDNVKFLIDGGFSSLKHIRDELVRAHKPDGDDDSTPEEIETQVHEDLASNEFYRMLQVIHGKANLDPLRTGFVNILYNFIEANNTYLPESVTVVDFYEEVLILFWRFLHSN